MKEVHYDNSDFDCIEASGDLEDAILRKAILADCPGNTLNAQAGYAALQRKWSVTGGKLVFPKEITDDLALHYQLCEKVGTGWYELKISVFDLVESVEAGSAIVWATVRVLSPRIQAAWLGHPKRRQCYPVWRIPPNGDIRNMGRV